MPRRTSSKEVVSGFAPTLDVVERVSEVIQQIDDLSMTVERYAIEAPEIRELVRQRDHCQSEFEAATNLAPESRQDVDSLVRLRDDLNAAIEGRYRPFAALDEEVRGFVSAVREFLDYLPANRPELQPIRFEIERLALWQMVADPFPIRMPLALSELKKLRMRLCEILEECNREKARTSSLKLQNRRSKIVDALQARLHLKGREDLADYFQIEVSRIRAAIRGDRRHSGPSTAEMILRACETHDVDCRGW